MHGKPERTTGRSILDSVVRTILSQNTTDITSARAFEQLKTRFPEWDQVLQAPAAEIVECIRCCGLADKRAEVIQGMLTLLQREQGELSMEHVRHMSTEMAKKYLISFKGIGPKTAACVLMFGDTRDEFPVDTHVWRITRERLRWAPMSASRETTYEHLNRRIPADLKYDLHVLLVTHGKHCPRCAKNGKNRRPCLGPCPLLQLPELLAAGGKYSPVSKAKAERRKADAKTPLTKGAAGFSSRIKKEQDGRRGNVKQEPGLRVKLEKGKTNRQGVKKEK